MNTKALAAGGAIPLMVVSMIVAASGAAGGAAAGAAAAATACLYGNPQTDIIVDTFLELTPNPVDLAHWDTHNTSTTPYDAATAADKHTLLTTFVRQTLNQPGTSLTSPPLIWWHGTLPADNDDTTWTTTTIPDWDGNLDTYLAAYIDTYVDLLANVTDYQCAPPTGRCPQPADNQAIAATIRHLESGNRYNENSHSLHAGYNTASGNPSGAYQYLASSWNSHGGYPEAWQAPADVQDERAQQDITRILNRFNSVDWVPVAWYVGDAGAQNVLDGNWPATYTPNPDYNRISIGDYQAKWLTHYRDIALPAAGITPNPCPTGNAAVIAWADTQIGAPYAAIDPYRFGTPPWPGGTRTGFRGDTYTFAAGTRVYDCSGFIITAYLEATGIDYRSLGIYGSIGFNTPQLPDADLNNLQPGDIIVYTPRNGVGHVVLVHHTDPNGTVRTIEATPSRGVNIGTLQWDRITAAKRPAN